MKGALNKDDKSPKADRWRTKVRQGRLSTIGNRNITIVERIRRIPTLLTASQHISILRSWRFLRGDNTLAAQKLARMFSLRATLSFSRYVFAERKRIYCKKVRGAALAKTEHIIKKLRYIVALRSNATQFVLEEKL